MSAIILYKQFDEEDGGTDDHTVLVMALDSFQSPFIKLFYLTLLVQ